MSKSFTPTEHNYDIYDKELLAVITALNIWHHYLEGAHYQIEIHSNHKNLIYFWAVQNLSWCQVWWIQFLTRFWFILEHVKGTQSTPDILSRHEDYEEGICDDNTNQIMLKPEYFK